MRKLGLRWLTVVASGLALACGADLSTLGDTQVAVPPAFLETVLAGLRTKDGEPLKLGSRCYYRIFEPYRQRPHVTEIKVWPGDVRLSGDWSSSPGVYLAYEKSWSGDPDGTFRTHRVLIEDLYASEKTARLEASKLTRVWLADEARILDEMETKIKERL